MPINTDFLKKAKEKGAITIYGYEMLLGQATRAFEIWHGMEAPYNAMKKALLGGV
jgi:shikimate dehydrogenase